MPELPEVETVVRDLRPRLMGRRITSIKVSKHPLRIRWSKRWDVQLLGRRVEQLWRRGKWIIIDLDRQLHLVFHLGMTGQLRVHSADMPIETHTHVVMGLDKNGNQLRFRDVRRFGCAVLFGTRTELDDFLQESRLGPEPFDLLAGYWRDRLTATQRCLKAALLDQRLVAGVGNIYADESLFQARLHPRQLGQQTSPAEAERLRKAIVRVLTRAIEQRGSSIRDYIAGNGEKGNYQDEFLVYGRPGEPCRRCETPIKRIRLAGRSTHFCPKCQGSVVRGQKSAR